MDCQEETTRTQRVPARLGGRAARRRRALPAIAAIAAVSALAAACGSGDSPQAGQGGISVTVPEQVAEANAAVLATRSGEGITAAGGSVVAGEPCPAPGSLGDTGHVTIAGVTPDLDRLGDIGLGNLVLDAWENIFESYINEVNGFGGINGHCFEFSFYNYGFTNPAEEIGAICAQLPQEQPLVLFGLAYSTTVAQCTTMAAQIPSIGLFSQFPEAAFAEAGGQLLVDHGSHEFLLDNELRTAVHAGVLGSDDAIGLLYSEDDTAPSMQATFDG